MGKTIKEIAEEIGVSKQALYKRVTGKLNSVCAPHLYTEFNNLCLDEIGEAIVKDDFKNKPCVTPLINVLNSKQAHTEQIHTSYGANTNPYVNPEVVSVSRTEHIQNAPISNTEQIRNSYGAYANPYTNQENISVSDTENIQNSHTVNTDMHTVESQNAYGTLPYSTNVQNTDMHTEHSVSNMEQIRNTYGANTNLYVNRESVSVSNTENIQNLHTVNTDTHTVEPQNTYGTLPHSANVQNMNMHTEHSVFDTEMNTDAEHIYQQNTEHIRNTYGADTEVDTLRTQLDESREKNHNMELELVKANAEKEKLEEIITQMKQRIDDKDSQIAEQRLLIEKTDNERKILTASLFKNNELMETILRLPLSKRIFGWRDIRKQLTAKQNDISDDITGEPDDTVTISFDEKTDKKD